MNTGVTPPGHGQKPASTLQSALVCEGPPHPWANQPQACRVSSWKPMLFKVNRPVSLGLWILWLKDISELLGSLGLRSIGRARNQASNYTRVPRCESTGGWGAASFLLLPHLHDVRALLRRRYVRHRRVLPLGGRIVLHLLFLDQRRRIRGAGAAGSTAWQRSQGTPRHGLGSHSCLGATSSRLHF